MPCIRATYNFESKFVYLNNLVIFLRFHQYLDY